MTKSDVIQFFDRLAPSWDETTIRDDGIISTILDNAGVRPGVDVLDVATGTGVLIPDYLNREVRSVTAVDISPEMIRIAQEKFRLYEQVRVICSDIEEFDEQDRYDAIIVYNAFPHFHDPERLICHLSGLLKEDGILTVAHGMSRSAIDHHHSGTASMISHGLMHEDDLAELFSRFLTVNCVISDDHMYQVCGKRQTF